MKNLCAIILGCLLALGAGAQAPSFQWARQMGGTTGNGGAYSVATDAQGNVYSTGGFDGTVNFGTNSNPNVLTSNSGSADIYIQKHGPAGNLIWVKQIGGAEYDVGLSLALDAAGNVYVTGWFDGTVDFDPGPDVFNLISEGRTGFLLKLNSNGEFVWAGQLGGTTIGITRPYSIKVDYQGNILVSGYFLGQVDFDPGPGTATLSTFFIDEYGEESASIGVFILKLGPSGNYVWAKQVGGNADGYAIAYSVGIDAAGNVLVFGYFWGTVDFNPGSGVFNQTSDDNNNPSVYILKLNADGDFSWARIIEGPFPLDFEIENFPLAVDAGGNVFVSATFDETVDFDPGPGVFNLTPIGGLDFFVLKLTSTGDFAWVRQFGGINSAAAPGYSMHIDGSGNLYIPGAFRGVVDFDPGAGQFDMDSGGSTSAFLMKLDGTGALLWVVQKQAAAGAFAYGYDVTTDQAGNIYNVGLFRGTVDFDPGPGTFNMTAPNNDFFDSGAFVLKLAQSPVSTEAQSLFAGVTLFPNPTSGHLTVQVDGLPDARIELYSPLGQLLRQSQGIQGGTHTLHIDGPAGVYFVKVQQGAAYRTFRVVKR